MKTWYTCFISIELVTLIANQVSNSDCLKKVTLNGIKIILNRKKSSQATKIQYTTDWFWAGAHGSCFESLAASWVATPNLRTLIILRSETQIPLSLKVNYQEKHSKWCWKNNTRNENKFGDIVIYMYSNLRNVWDSEASSCALQNISFLIKNFIPVCLQ